MKISKKRSGQRKAIILLSGGLDSATTLYLAKAAGFECFCLVFDYGQRHNREIECAKALAKKACCKAKIIKINLPWKGSSLLDKQLKVPLRGNGLTDKPVNIPSTYVPARNIIFLSFALSYAEAIGACAIFIGAHAQDYSGYPDCRTEFYKAFSKVVSCGTKAGVQKRRIEIKTPLIDKKKSEIIRLGASLRVPFGLTWSCYRGGKNSCGRCDSCYYRAKGFREAGLRDTLSANR